MLHNAKQEWDEFVARESAFVTPWLSELGYELAESQPHIEGERYLMQAVTTTSGPKLILLGRHTATGKKVVVKVTNDSSGIRELIEERTARQTLQDIRFAYQIFFSPEELLFKKRNGHVLSIQEFIEQDTPFLGRSIEEQFTFALQAFKAQEGAHAATYEHARSTRNLLGSKDAQAYLAQFALLTRSIQQTLPEDTNLATVLEQAHDFLVTHQETIEQYTGFLTHTDFVPHNIRIKEGRIYLLDHSALRFGNKYEGWARFLNFMTLYNPRLERAFVLYVLTNRAPEEVLALRLMRAYRLTEILAYYVRTLARSEGNLLILNRARIVFWKEALIALLHDEELASSVREEYVVLRDRLRSHEENRRQEGLH